MVGTEIRRSHSECRGDHKGEGQNKQNSVDRSAGQCSL